MPSGKDDIHQVVSLPSPCSGCSCLRGHSSRRTRPASACGSACERRGTYRLRRATRNTTTRTTNSAVKTATKAPALIPIRPPSEVSQDDSIGDHRSNLEPRWGSARDRSSSTPSLHSRYGGRSDWADAGGGTERVERRRLADTRSPSRSACAARRPCYGHGTSNPLESGVDRTFSRPCGPESSCCGHGALSGCVSASAGGGVLAGGNVDGGGGQDCEAFGDAQQCCGAGLFEAPGRFDGARPLGLGSLEVGERQL